MTPRTIIPLSIALISLFFAQQFVLPLWGAVQTFQAQRSEAEHTLEDLRARYEERRRIFDAWRALDESKKDRVLLAIPDAGDTPNLLVFLDRAIQENGLLSGQIDIGSSQAPSARPASLPETFQELSSTVGGAGGLFHIPITLSVQGEYESIKAFFLRLERHLRILTPDTFSLRAQLDEEGVSALDARITLKAYQLPPEANP